MKLEAEIQHENCACTAVTITVTEAYVQRQDQGNCYTCAVALAIRDVLRRGVVAHVTRHSWQIRTSYNWSNSVRLQLSPAQCFPVNTQRFIASLDAGCVDVDLPHTFTTSIPNEYLKGEQD